MAVHARITMLAFILLSSILGVATPFIIVRYGSTDVLKSFAMDLLQCFAVGLICGVAILHIFFDAQEDLSSVSDFPIAGTLALFGCFAMLAINRIASLVAAQHSPAADAEHGAREHTQPLEGAQEGGFGIASAENATATNGITAPGAGRHVRPMTHNSSGSFHGHTHQRLALDPSLGHGFADRVKAYLLESAIAVHSVLVGVAIGVIDESASSEATLEVFILGSALCFHQVFEGIAVGHQGVRVGLRGQACAVMILLFALSCPIGGLLGMAVSSWLQSDSMEVILGALNAVAAGTLIEIGFVDMLPELFSHKHAHDEKISLRHEYARLLALAFGGGVMAVLAIWA